MLILPIKKKWFDMIKSGEKKEEYREIKPYWTSRLKYYAPGLIVGSNTERVAPTFEVGFRNGYSQSSPTIKCKCKLRIGVGKPEWGAEPNKEYYILEILEVIQMICSEKERERIKINLKNNTIEKQENMKNIAEYIEYLEQENTELKTQRDYYKREYSLYNKTLEEASKVLTKRGE